MPPRPSPTAPAESHNAAPPPSESPAQAKSTKRQSSESADRYDTNRPDDTGYYGRSVHYSTVHKPLLDTYYNLISEMKDKRLPQPTPIKKL